MHVPDGLRGLREQTVFTGRITVVDELVQLPTGKLTHHVTVRHPGAVVMIPRQDDGTFLLIKQYRHSVRQMLLEFPAGTIEAGEAPLQCAKRELAEEVGRTARSWEFIGEMHPAPGFCSEVQYGYVASQLTACALAHDEDELIEVVSMTGEAVERAIRHGQLTDSKSVALYARAKLRGLV
jgi:ADP-ribose pyrophosphatase